MMTCEGIFWQPTAWSSSGSNICVLMQATVQALKAHGDGRSLDLSVGLLRVDAFSVTKSTPRQITEILPDIDYLRK